MRPTRVPSRRLVKVVSIVVVGAAVVFAAGHWWTHPQVLEGSGASWSGETAVGRPQIVTVVHRSEDDGETLRVLDVEPRVVRDETAARFEFLTCVLKDPNLGIGISGEEEIDEVCASTEPGIGSSLGGPAGRSSQLLMKVTTTRPGRLEIDGADITYRRSARHLFQTGTQQSGLVSNITAKAG